MQLPRVWSSLLKVKIAEDGIPRKNARLATAEDSYRRKEKTWMKTLARSRNWDVRVSGSSVTFLSPSPRMNSSNL